MEWCGNCDVVRRDCVEFWGVMCGWGGERRGLSWLFVLWELVVFFVICYMGNVILLVKFYF